ncbi:hypothetical protein N9S61_03100, partial [Alphaproteobacteria bacterium]|nr:hypothetical protein [Alphaproteobacteria bacterium]
CHTARGLLNRQKLANSSPEEFLKYLFRQNKYFAKKRKIKHTLRFDELIEIYEKQKGYCALTNEKMTFKLSTGKIGTNASIDRINSKKIYKKSNVRFVTDLNNRALHTFNDNEVKFYCKKILKNFYKISL